MSQPSQPTSINLAIRGLYTNPSTFGDNAPIGALHQADNVVIDRPGVVATRRGFKNDWRQDYIGTQSIHEYNGSNITYGQYPTMGTLYTEPFFPYGKIEVQTIGTTSNSFVVPDYTNLASRIRSMEVNKNFYFITGPGPNLKTGLGVDIPNSGATGGTYVLDSLTSAFRKAGAPAGLGGFGAVTGASGFLATNTQIAYRVVFGYKDANQQLILGAPSTRIVIQNTSGATRNCNVTFQQPDEIQTSPTNFFFQLYRSNASTTSTTEPDDEMALCYEGACTSAAEITVTDITPTTLLGAALYTNSGQEGILQSNYRPPWAYDLCTYKQFAFYANTRTAATLSLTLINSAVPTGLGAATITFTGFGQTFTLTAGTANNYTTGYFAVSATGNAAFDIQQTANNIILVANGIATNPWLDAYYVSNANGLPGKMVFTANRFNDASITMTTNNTSLFAEPSTLWTSKAESHPNRVYFSKFNQPGAVPVVNYLDVGSANKKINRIIPLRDGVMVLKQDGVFRISNAAPPFTVTPIDYNVRILADNTAAELDNMVYFLSDQGVVALSDSDAKIMSFVLDKTIIENTTPELYPNLDATAWGCAYQSDRKYLMGMPTSGTATGCDQQYVYNHLTQNWTRWTIPSTSVGYVNKTNGILLVGTTAGSAPTANVVAPLSLDWTQSFVYEEHKTFTNADYVDAMYTLVNQTTGTTNSITVTVAPSDNYWSLFNDYAQLVGWDLIQTSDLVNGIANKIISVVDAGADPDIIGNELYTLEMTAPNYWTAGTVTLCKPINVDIKTIQIDCQNPSMNKQFTEMIYMFTEQSFREIEVEITSNTAGVPEIDYLVPGRNNGWGIDPWGTSPWGGTPSGQGKVRRIMPQKVQRAGWIFIELKNSDSFSSFGLSGIAIPFKNTSTRQFGSP